MAKDRVSNAARIGYSALSRIQRLCSDMLEAQPEEVERYYWRIHLVGVVMNAIVNHCLNSRRSVVSCDAWADRDRSLPPDRF